VKSQEAVALKLLTLAAQLFPAMARLLSEALASREEPLAKLVRSRLPVTSKSEHALDKLKAEEDGSVYFFYDGDDEEKDA